MECNHKGCAQLALAMAENCWDHLPDRDAYTKRLEQAIAGGAETFSGANLKKVILKNARLEKADLARACLSQADLTGSYLFDANLEGAELVGTDLSGCDLTHCNLKTADMMKASLAGARLWNADLTGANLTESDMSGADLWNAKLFDVKLWHADIGQARSIAQTNFLPPGSYREARINESGEVSAEESYRDLKQYFASCGKYNDASWASFREKIMERISLKKRKAPDYIPSLLMSVLCGYGEKPYRIIAAALGCILLFALLYAALGSVVYPPDPSYKLKWFDYIYYSAITYTTVGYGDFIPKAQGAFRFLAAAEGFIGVFLSGLFIFTLARKYSAR